jgi:hypothetical protein
LAVVHDDVPGDAAWVAAAGHRAAAVVSLQPVEGRTAELDGQLQLLLRWCSSVQSGLVGGLGVGERGAVPGSQGWYFRCSDTGVKWLREIDGRALLGV